MGHQAALVDMRYLANANSYILYLLLFSYYIFMYFVFFIYFFYNIQLLLYSYSIIVDDCTRNDFNHNIFIMRYSC